MPLVSKSMPCRQRPFESTSLPAWKANRQARRRPHGPHSPTRDRTVRRSRGLRVPSLGEDLCSVSANCAKKDAQQERRERMTVHDHARSVGRTNTADQSHLRIVNLPRHTARNRQPRAQRARVRDSDLQIVSYLVRPSGRFSVILLNIRELA